MSQLECLYDDQGYFDRTYNITELPSCFFIVVIWSAFITFEGTILYQTVSYLSRKNVPLVFLSVM